MLLDELGREHFLEGSKSDIAVNCFRELFMSSNSHDVESLFTGFQPRVTTTMNNLLVVPVSEEEVKRAAFCVKGNSAPVRMDLQEASTNVSGILLDPL